MVWYQRKTVWALGILLIILTVNGISVFVSEHQKEVPAVELKADTKESTSEEREEIKENQGLETKIVTVYLCGSVANPGVYHLEPGARVCDVVQLAGGLTEKADELSVNLAEPLVDGQQIIIYEQSEKENGEMTLRESGTKSKAPMPVVQSAFPVSINRATAEELTLLEGVGEKTAEKIIDYRNTQGRFKTIDELKNVPGIGEKKFEKIKDSIKL